MRARYVTTSEQGTSLYASKVRHHMRARHVTTCEKGTSSHASKVRYYMRVRYVITCEQGASPHASKVRVRQHMRKGYVMMARIRTLVDSALTVTSREQSTITHSREEPRNSRFTHLYM